MNATAAAQPGRNGASATVHDEQGPALLRRVQLSRAAELARNGNHAAAEALLRDLTTGADAPAEALELLARIAAQQGRTREAEALFERAAAADPSDSRYHEALARLARHRSGVRWAGPLALVLAGSLLLAAAAGALQARRWMDRYDRRLQDGLAAQQTSAHALQAEVIRLAGESAARDTVMTRELTSQAAQIGLLQQDTRGLATGIDRLSADAATRARELDRALSDQQQTLAGLESRLDALATTLAANQSALNGELLQQQRSIAALRSQVALLSGEVAGLRRSIQQVTPPGAAP